MELAKEQALSLGLEHAIQLTDQWMTLHAARMTILQPR